MSQDAERLVVEHVRKEFATAAGPLTILADVSLTLSPGESLAVVGSAGAGQSTLLNIIGSLEKPTSGSVALGGQEVAALKGAELAAFRSRRVGFVFQDHHLLPQCTAIENVVLPTLAAGRTDGNTARAAALLERVGLGERMASFPAKLSGGERQRVAIARALVNEPPLLLCDEPTGNLDAATSERIASLFIELATEKGAMLIIVTHDRDLARACARALELHNGTLRPLRPRTQTPS